MPEPAVVSEPGGPFGGGALEVVVGWLVASGPGAFGGRRFVPTTVSDEDEADSACVCVCEILCGVA